MDQQLSRENRANIVTACESLRCAANRYDDVDFDRAMEMRDQVLPSTYPHDPGQCVRCGVVREGGARSVEVTGLACNAAWRESS
ncbi:MAG TPA: hypothetical protein VGW38_29315 [Chloroflexota bacterium]|nr:hypothetical protein [Chloroflexota bacterium]